MNLKDQRLASAVSELAAEFLNRESNRTSLITITRTIILNKGRRATVMFTVIPDSEEANALEFLQRKRRDLRKFISSKKIVGFSPSIEFELDLGEKNRQRIDELSNESNLDTSSQKL